jgi:hypothetical protein
MSARILFMGFHRSDLTYIGISIRLFSRGIGRRNPASPAGARLIFNKAQRVWVKTAAKRSCVDSQSSKGGDSKMLTSEIGEFWGCPRHPTRSKRARAVKRGIFDQRLRV